MSEIRNLTRNGETFYPLTHVDAIVNRDGEAGVDETPEIGSHSLIESGGVYRGLYNKVELERSVNLFDKDSNNLFSGYIGESSFITDPKYRLTHPIYIEGGVSYKAYHHSSLGTNYFVAICDVNGNYISKFLGTLNGNFLIFSNNSDCYVRVQIGNVALDNTLLSTFMVCKESEYPNTYAPYDINIEGGLGLNNKMESEVTDIVGVQLSNLNFVKKDISVNLFDKDSNDLLYGIISINGISPNDGYIGTHLIHVTSGNSYKCQANTRIYGNNANSIAVYNENKIYVGIIEGTVDNDFLTFTAPYNCYVRINLTPASGLTNYLNSFMFCKLSDWPSEYVPYYIAIEEGVQMNETMKNQISSFVPNLYDKSVIFTGDSICAGSTDSVGGGWARRIGEKYNMNWVNKAVGGGTIIDKDLVGSSFTICDTDFSPGADYIILEGGTNDADRIGSILGSDIPQLFGTYNLNDYRTVYTNSTFCSAFERMIQRVVTTYPTSKVGYIVAMKMTSVSGGYDKEHNNRRAYFETAIEICKKWGVPVLNLWDNCTMNPRLLEHFDGTVPDEDGLYWDGQHPTSHGYDMISPIIAAWMETL